MITLKKIKLINFLSHKEPEINFKENQKLLLDGVSGSGKSSIVEGLIWTLYGKGRVENRNLVRRGAKSASVILELSNGKECYRIERTCDTNSKHTLSIGKKKGNVFNPIKKTGLRDNQLWIEKEFLKCSYALFINSVAYPQDNIENFVKQTAVNRKDMLMEIANTENYEEYYEKAKKMLDLFSTDLMRINFSIERYSHDMENDKKIVEDSDNLGSILATKEEEIGMLKKNITEIQEKDNYSKELKNQIELNNVKLKSLNSKISDDKESILRKNRKIEGLDSYNEEDIKIRIKERDELKKRVSDLKEALEKDYELQLRRNAIMMHKPVENDFSATLERLNGQLLDIQMSNDNYCEYLKSNCPKLEQETKKKSIFLEEQIKDIRNREEENKKAIKVYTEELEAIPLPVTTEEDKKQFDILTKQLDFYKDVDSMESIRVEKDKIIIDLKKEIDELKMSISLTENDVNGLINSISSLQEELSSLPVLHLDDFQIKLDSSLLELSEIKHKISQVEIAKENIKNNESAIKESEKKKNEITDKIESLNLIKEAFGSKGIKTVVIDYLIPRLEYRINEILSKMSDFKIRLETQKSKADGEGIIEGLFINIYNESGEQFSFENYSGGQKLKITVAISEALASMQQCGFRIFDEVFVGLDNDSIEGFNEVMHSLQDKFSQILCISHLQTIKDSFPEKITIIKDGQTSQAYAK
jgi:DNA repair protein SbcC/Rad50